MTRLDIQYGRHSDSGGGGFASSILWEVKRQPNASSAKKKRGKNEVPEKEVHEVNGFEQGLTKDLRKIDLEVPDPIPTTKN